MDAMGRPSRSASRRACRRARPSTGSAAGSSHRARAGHRHGALGGNVYHL